MHAEIHLIYREAIDLLLKPPGELFIVMDALRRKVKLGDDKQHFVAHDELGRPALSIKFAQTNVKLYSYYRNVLVGVYMEVPRYELIDALAHGATMSRCSSCTQWVEEPHLYGANDCACEECYNVALHRQPNMSDA